MAESSLETPARPRASVWRRWFVTHPASVGETYAEHLAQALVIAGRSLAIAAAAGVHALVPALCRDTASRGIARLDRTLRERSGRRRPQAG